MIKGLKVRFIILSMASLLILMTLILIGMNIINYSTVKSEADEILSLLSQNKGTFPEFQDGRGSNHLPPHMSPELPYESRFFSVLINSSGEVIFVETSRIATVNRETAINYAKKIRITDDSSGFIDRFRFISKAEGDTTRITFLDCGRQLDAFKSFLITSIVMAIAGLVAVFFVIFFFAGKILRPISESYKKQKRFITDAGHEIKTPLTIINANIDLLEIELGSNESTDEIRQQTKRLTSLANDLVYLARMEEAENKIQMIDFPISETVQETVDQFKLTAKAQNKEIYCNIQPMLSMTGNDRSIRQFISILMDNALKYSCSDSKISIELTRQSKNLVLSVSNTTSVFVDKKDLDRIFDRFYRTDPSRNSSTGGYGIGLSIASAIVQAHRGKIQASIKDQDLFTISAIFPR